MFVSSQSCGTYTHTDAGIYSEQHITTISAECIMRKYAYFPNALKMTYCIYKQLQYTMKHTVYLTVSNKYNASDFHCD